MRFSQRAALSGGGQDPARGHGIDFRSSITGKLFRQSLAAIFDDFATTKRRGLGLGLATSKRIVEQLDGTITVESEVGRGTSFTLRFPATDSGRAEVAS